MLELAVRKHYSKIGKLGRKAVDTKYPLEIRREWYRKGAIARAKKARDKRNGLVDKVA